MTARVEKNLLCYGDNLDFLRHFDDACVDLIYLDPPFNSQQSYNVLFKETTGEPEAAQIKAFEDTWTWDLEANKALTEIQRDPAVPAALADLTKTFMAFLKPSPMMAYLVQMAVRLVQMHRVLKPTGSLYLHCDATASHYLKLILDAIFGIKNFRNEVFWYYYNKMHDRRKKLFPRATDTLLFYVKDVNADFTFNQLKEQREEAAKQLKRKKVGGRMVNVKDAQGNLVYQMKADRTLDNVWRIPCLQPAARERMGYPTQKPLELLRRVIAASSNPGQVILDPFCGCGTTIDAVETLNRENPGKPPRRWIGIDITHVAIGLVKHRLATRFKPPPEFQEQGVPVSQAGAVALAAQDPFDFQYWALGLVGARPVGGKRKKGADRGIDGVRYFQDEQKNGAFLTKKMLVQVKSGHVKAGDIRDLAGTIGREGAELGVFITLEEPSKPMRSEAAAAGTYQSPYDGQAYPKVQVLTIAEILKDPHRPNPRCLHVPGGAGGPSVTLPDAPKHKVKRVRQKDMEFEGGEEP